MPRPAPVELLIARTWDGEAIAVAERVRVRLRRAADGLRITVLAPLHHDPPPPGPPGALDGLWQHEVVELFVATAGGGDAPAYTEVELSPWGHHLVLQLEGIRRRVGERLPLRYRVRRDGGRWIGSATLGWTLLPRPPWSVNAFAVHGGPAHRRYLAASPLPGPRPDFHQPSRFPLFPG